MPAIKADLSKKVAVATTKATCSTATIKKEVKPSPVSTIFASAGAALAFSAAHPSVTRAWGNTAYIPDGTEPHMTPSLKAFLYSCLWGGLVLGVIFAAVLFVSSFDPIRNFEEEA